MPWPASRWRAGCTATGIAVAASLLLTPAQAADYYAGKTIDFLVGGDVGGGYDIYARTFAPASRPLHSWQSHHRHQEPAGRRQRPRGDLPLRRRAQGRLGDRRGLPGLIMGPLLDDRTQAAIRSDQVPVSRQRRQRDARLHQPRALQHQALRGRAHAEGHYGRKRGRRLHARLHQHAQEGDRRDVRAGRGLQGHRRHLPRHGARRGRRHVRARLDEPEVAAARLGARQDRQHPRPDQPGAASRSSPGSACRRSGTSSAAPTTRRRSS